MTTGENTRPGDARSDQEPLDPMPWHVDVREGVFVGDMLGVTPPVGRARWADLPALTAHALARLRVDVLVAEAGRAHSELDQLDVDPRTEHLWIADGDLLVACLRLVRRDDGTPCVDRACARPDVRPLGLTGALVIDVVARYGAGPLQALVRTDSLGAFLQVGFEVTGPARALPGGSHTPMARRPDAPWRE